jgi:excisionase family DNA binding protein
VTHPKPVQDIPVVKPAALRIADAAKYLSISESLLRKLVREGRLPSVKIGTIRLIATSSLDRLAERGA